MTLDATKIPKKKPATMDEWLRRWGIEPEPPEPEPEPKPVP